MAKEAGSVGSRDGVLNVNKAPGWTSHDVVAKLRPLFPGFRIGHGGTLDPTATGVLPVLVGRATRIAEYLLDWDKEYRAVLRLGVTTETQDATGAIVARRPVAHLSLEQIREAIDRFRGSITQVPPMYSAVKVAGQPLYKAARAGRTVEREPRPVTVYDLDVLSIALPDVAFRVRCSKGTYVRTLCADIGEGLGVGGHLLALERTRVGPLAIEAARTIEETIDDYRHGRLAMLSLDAALAHLPALVVSEPAAERARYGVPIPAHAVRWAGEFTEEPNLKAAEPFRVRLKGPDGLLIGLGTASGQRDRIDSVKIEKILVQTTTPGAVVET
ncbi:tRNA pseudouridine(55) synthase TruB [Candidatus Nitrospira bockiana]